MEQKLALELKIAGFPQVIHEYGDYYGGDNAEDYICVPTLEELIEACGNPFMLMWMEDSSQEWGGTFQAFNDTHSFCSETGLGKTAIEAVARLWLALNKKV